MMEKHLRQFSSIQGLPGVRSVQLIKDVDSLIKSASNFSYEFSPEFLENIESAKERMYPNEILIATISVGDGEIYGPNVNGDWFSTETLDKIYKTFETGHTFIEHNNRDVSLSVGRILYAFKNKKMRRIELLNTAEKGKADIWISRINRGEPVDVSFGYKTPWDECSICHNRARRRSEYCKHLSFQMNQILPDGSKVYAINPPVGRFFEISFVKKGAVPIARMMKKVAHENSSSVFVGFSASEEDVKTANKRMTTEDAVEEVTRVKSAGVKLAEMVKNIESNLSRSGVDPAVLKDISSVAFPFSMKYENPINPSVFKGFSLGESMANMGEAGIVPSRSEFASILSVLALKISDIERAVDRIERGMVAYNNDECSSEKLNIIPSDSLRRRMLSSGIIENRSWLGPRVVKRIIVMSGGRGMRKTSSESILVPSIVGSIAVGKLYSEYLKKVAPTRLTMLEKSIKKNPKVAMALIFSSIMLPRLAVKPSVNYEYKKASISGNSNEELVKESKFLTNIILPTAISNIASAHLYNQQQAGKKLDPASVFVANHPFITSAIASGTMMGRKKMLGKIFKKKASVISYNEASEYAIGVMMGVEMEKLSVEKANIIKINIEEEL